MSSNNSQINILKEQLKLEDERFEKMLKRIHPIKKRFMSVYRNLSSKELEVLKYYKSTGYSTINGFILKNPVYRFFN